MGFPGGSDCKESACKAGDLVLIPGSGRFPGEGNGNPLQYSGLENSVDRGTWWATVHGVAESITTEQLSLSEKTMVQDCEQIKVNQLSLDQTVCVPLPPLGTQ